jgi:hypothetical protein
MRFIMVHGVFDDKCPAMAAALRQLLARLKTLNILFLV